MWQFEHPEYLYALLLPVAVALGYALSRHAKEQVRRRIGQLELLRAMTERNANRRELSQLWKLLVAMAFFSFAVANPQLGVESDTVKQRSLDVIVALDVSLSMLAEDVPPSRLEQAKQFARELIGVLRGERIGLVLLAGNAYPQIPLTTDFAAVDMGVRSAHPGMAPNAGTAIGEAVDVSVKLFGETTNAGKVLIVISDGETHDEGITLRAKAAGKQGVSIICVGVGSAEGGFIPVQVAGRGDYKRDERGEPVRSRLQERILREVAGAGNGAYFLLQPGESRRIAGSIKDRIDRMEKQEMERRRFERFTSYFQLFLGAGLFFLAWAAWQRW